MKHTKRILSLLLLVLMFVSLLPASAFAADRQYMTRIYSGNIGTFSGGSTVYQVTSPYSDVGENYPAVTLNTGNDSYYVKGIKESGKDGLLTTYTPNADRDYVVAYGVRGHEVKYKVYYRLNGTGTTGDDLAAPQEFYADVGDRPISSYIYIEGYQPYLRSTKTLVGGADAEAENVLYAYYTRVTTTTTTAAPANNNNNVIANVNNANANNNANNANANNNANNPAPAPAQPAYQQTEDILDLDVPLAEPEAATGTPAPATPTLAPEVLEPSSHSRVPRWVIVLGAIGLLALIALFYWYMLFYRKRKKYADEDIPFPDFDPDDPDMKDWNSDDK